MIDSEEPYDIDELAKRGIFVEEQDNYDPYMTNITHDSNDTTPSYDIKELTKRGMFVPEL